MAIEDIYRRARELAQVDETVVTRPDDQEDYTDLDSMEGRCILEAIDRYSLDKPWVTNVKLTVTPGKYSALLPVEWTEDFKLLDIYYEGSGTSEDYIPMHKSDWVYHLDMSQVPARWRVKFNTDVTEAITVVYCRPHESDPFATTQTIPKRDETAIAKLAAANILRIAQAYYVKKNETSTVGGDTVNYGQLASRARQMAADYENYYKSHLSRFASSTQGASQIFSWDMTSVVDGKGWLFRGR